MNRWRGDESEILKLIPAAPALELEPGCPGSVPPSVTPTMVQGFVSGTGAACAAAVETRKAATKGAKRIWDCRYVAKRKRIGGPRIFDTAGEATGECVIYREMIPIVCSTYPFSSVGSTAPAAEPSVSP